MISLKKYTLLLFVLLFLSCKKDYQNLSQFVNDYTFTNVEEFIKVFPFEKYFESNRISNMQQMEADKNVVVAKFGATDGETFTYHLIDYYLEQHPVKADSSVMGSRIILAERYLTQPSPFFKNVGYFMLGQVAVELLENGNKLSKKNYQLFHTKLGTYRINIPVAKDFWERLKEKLDRDGLVGTIERLGGEAKGVVSKISNTFSETKKDDLVRETSDFKYKGSSEKKMHNGISTIFDVTLRSENDKKVGEVVLLKCSDASHTFTKASLMTGASVEKQLNTMRSTKEEMVAMSAAFTSSNGNIDGLSFLHGVPQNYMLLPTLGGLGVIKNGDFSVINLRSETIELPFSGEKIDNPIKKLKGYAALLNWCKNNSLTTFQTILLAHDNKLKISNKKSSGSETNRRLFFKFYDNAEKMNKYGIMNLTSPFSLYEAAHHTAQRVLMNPSWNLEFIINLDTGSKDIMKLYDEKGQVRREVKGVYALSKANNLLVLCKQ
jgi:hypothetical protein